MIAPSLIGSAVENSPALFGKLLALLQFVLRFGSTATVA
ncbi:hypothetical protein BH18GEM1_BH18GEM1_19260 [soil metagenome]